MILAATFIPARASSIASSVDALFFTLLIVSAFFTLLIAALIITFTLKYRRTAPAQVGANVADNGWLEFTWFLIPLLIVLCIFLWGAKLFLSISTPASNAMEINVIGKQWMWKIQHPSGRKEINELHVPLGRPIKLLMTSQDVIHSFYIPAFRIKQDVVPGRYSQESFIPTKLGNYPLYCSKYCGTGHATMEGRVFVMEPGAYEQWTAGGAPEDRPDVAGAHLFTQYGCITCHGTQGPTLAGIYGRTQPLEDGRIITVDDDYIRESILAPRAKIVRGYPPIMPSYAGQLSEEQLFQLVAYIKSLRGDTKAVQP